MGTPSTLASIARATVIGTIVSPAEVRHTSGGKPITSFRIRVDEAFRDRTGATQVRSSEMPVTYWGEHSLDVGALVYIDARLSGRSYESRGAERWALELTVDKLVYLGGGSPEQPSRQTSPRSAPASSPPPDDDIPF